MKARSALLMLVALSLFRSLSLTRSKASIGENTSMEEQIIAKEREGLEALKAGDVGHFGDLTADDLTADDAIFVDSQGLATKAQVLQNVVGFKLTDYTIENVRFAQVSPNSGLIAYKISEKGLSHGKEQVYVSSIWIQREGKWLCLFSQETAAR
jgi:hypothetical protein